MKGFLKSRVVTVLLMGLLVVVGFVTARLLSQKYQIDKQIAELQDRADRIKGENQQLSDLVKYLNTPQYQEKEAREKLNLKKDGEFVVGLPQGEVAGESQTIVVNKTNPQKWFDYFFSNQSN